MFAIILMVLLIDKTGLWLKRKGYLYYRMNKPKRGILGSALLELNAHLSPANQYVIEIQQTEVLLKGDLINAQNKLIDDTPSHIKK